MAVKRSGKLQNVKAKVENGAKNGLLLAGDKIAQDATRIAPIKAGRLKRSITRSNPKKNGNNWSVTIGTDVEYARAQEFGSGLHATRGPKQKIKIVPKKQKGGKKALAFKWPGAPSGLEPSASGKFVFKSIMHPGVKAQPYLRPALDQNREIAVKIIGNAIVGALTSG